MATNPNCIFLSLALFLLALFPSFAQGEDFPAVLSIKDRIRVVNEITKKRLDILLPCRG